MDFDKHYIKNGVYAGLICSLIYFASHTFDPGFYIKQSKVFGGLILILFLVKSSKDERTSLGGYATFADLLKVSFFTYLIAALIISIFTYFLYNFINPELAKLELDIMREVMVKVFVWMDTPEDGIDNTLAALDEIGYQKDFLTILTDFIAKLFTGLILSLIIAAIFKNNKVA